MCIRDRRARGRTVIVWSAGGGPYAQRRAEQHDVAHLVDAFHGKDSRDSNGAYEVHHLVAVSYTHLTLPTSDLV